MKDTSFPLRILRSLWAITFANRRSFIIANFFCLIFFAVSLIGLNNILEIQDFILNELSTKPKSNKEAGERLNYFLEQWNGNNFEYQLIVLKRTEKLQKKYPANTEINDAYARMLISKAIGLQISSQLITSEINNRSHLYYLKAKKLIHANLKNKNGMSLWGQANASMAEAKATSLIGYSVVQKQQHAFPYYRTKNAINELQNYEKEIIKTLNQTAVKKISGLQEELQQYRITIASAITLFSCYGGIKKAKNYSIAIAKYYQQKPNEIQRSTEHAKFMLYKFFCEAESLYAKSIHVVEKMYYNLVKHPNLSNKERSRFKAIGAIIIAGRYYEVGNSLINKADKFAQYKKACEWLTVAKSEHAKYKIEPLFKQVHNALRRKISNTNSTKSAYCIENI